MTVTGRRRSFGGVADPFSIEWMKDRKDVKQKLRIDFVVTGMPRALQEVARRCMAGDAKYGNPNTWQASQGDPDVYLGAMMRHLLAVAAGEEMDEETGLTHASAVAWNAMVWTELLARRKEALDKQKRRGRLPG